ncbi:MAG: hypothetical protein PHN92_05570 [Geobacter sp.]|nr:hypothetical protein [Geobacter sp.]
MKLLKKWLKKIAVWLINHARSRPTIKALALGNLKHFPGLESRLRRLTGSEGTPSEDVLSVMPASREHLSPQARTIYASLSVAIQKRSAGDH